MFHSGKALKMANGINPEIRPAPPPNVPTVTPTPEGILGLLVQLAPNVARVVVIGLGLVAVAAITGLWDIDPFSGLAIGFVVAVAGLAVWLMIETIERPAVRFLGVVLSYAIFFCCSPW
jgi:hypothetical protein